MAQNREAYMSGRPDEILRPSRGYHPIADYAIIGDAHTAALIARDGSIDWCCWPRFDSDAVFCRMLDAVRGGFMQVCPSGRWESHRAYLEDTNVLQTSFETDSGRVRIIDFMPVQMAGDGHRGEDIRTTHRLIRIVEGLSGAVDVDLAFVPTFGYATVPAVMDANAGGAVARGGPHQVWLTAPWPLQAGTPGQVCGRRQVMEGDRLPIVLTYSQTTSAAPAPLDSVAVDAALAQTSAYWREWMARCTYVGPYAALVRRSALLLKLLTFEPTGAIIAAPTTSLPEELGGVRNWDYRYTWLRDAALTLDALMSIGYHDESIDFWNWLQQVLSGRTRLQIMYRVDGSADLSERVLPHLEGYAGSAPVRVGNAASDQRQVDVYGEILDAAHVCATAMGAEPHRRFSDVRRIAADRAVAEWRDPDHGIWEMRAEPRHFLYSKLLCWVAVDRAVRLSEMGVLDGDSRMWSSARDEIRAAILERGFDPSIGAFTQAFDTPALDASALMMPLVGFLPARDVRIASTINAIQDRLTSHGLVYRYLAEDGLPGGEATFALCTFWMVDALALSGRVDEAEAMFARVTGFANDVGLLSEEIEPVSGQLLGNFPQAFTHLALIRSAVRLAGARQGRTAEGSPSRTGGTAGRAAGAPL
jgi:GH15 family glucan-1,4-alpha-glucosidase